MVLEEAPLPWWSSQVYHIIIIFIILVYCNSLFDNNKNNINKSSSSSSSINLSAWYRGCHTGRHTHRHSGLYTGLDKAPKAGVQCASPQDTPCPDTPALPPHRRTQSSSCHTGRGSGRHRSLGKVWSVLHVSCSVQGTLAPLGRRGAHTRRKLGLRWNGSLCTCVYACPCAFPHSYVVPAPGTFLLLFPEAALMAAASAACPASGCARALQSCSGEERHGRSEEWGERRKALWGMWQVR